ncbi:MAG TPA: hypothetical protein VK886_08205 [Vicinamibacterales bacterium]|nr:hypothetical protein [Vicinamibacterales bacterium]
MSSTAAGAVADVHRRDDDGLLVPSRTRRRRGFGIVAGVIFTLICTPVVFAAMWPVTFDSREELFEIPKGTWARRMAGDMREILPSEIHLLVGIRDVLKLKNSDDVPQIFGPTLLMPGQTLRLPFTTPSENYFACTAHASGQLVIVVEAAPTWPWSRLSWRVRRMLRWVSEP